MADQQEHTTDVIIVGAGPTGLFAVFQCGMLGLRCHVVDARDAVGGQCTALYPEKPIYDIPSRPSVSAAELIDHLAAQAAPFAPAYHLGQTAMAIDDDGVGNLTLTTGAGARIRARAVIVAAGSGSFQPNRPPLPGIELYEGRGVRYAVDRRADFHGARVVVAGGGDSAVDWAVELCANAASVALVHRRARFRAAPATVRRMEELAAAGRIDLVIPYQLAGLDGRDGRLDAVRVRTTEGDERRLPADILLPCFGLTTAIGPLADWRLTMDCGSIRVDPPTMATSRPGIFAIGDIATYPGKLKLILCGFAEAATAARAAYALARPGQALHFEYSTSRGVPHAA